MKEKVGHNFGNPFSFPLFLVSELKPSTFPCMDKTINKKTQNLTMEATIQLKLLYFTSEENT